LSLPQEAKVFTYSFGYDLTKALEDVDNQKLYRLFRPELRKRNPGEEVRGPHYVWWKGCRCPNPCHHLPYSLNFQGSKFSVRQGKRKRVIWDIFKFYQGKFVTALEDWKVGDQALYKRMKRMKDARSEFDKVYEESPQSIRAYCLEECACMAQLAHKLVDAHKAAGLELRSFYGAGSTASAMLKVMGIREQMKAPIPEMKMAVASAFFGGRFENSVVGPIREKVYNWDIASAYPYQITFLPCLLHGRWERSSKRKELTNCRTAVVQYSMRGRSKFEDWGPFPYRTQDGSICFPVESGGGWVWKDEYIEGEKLFPNVKFVESWNYYTDCDCQPFKKMPEYYRERVRIGKEGPGIVLKLGTNASFGKLAQSVGNAPYNNWIWAGMITSGCRAQILRALGQHKDRANMLMVATDGIYTREKLDMPAPRDTGTFGLEKPALGAWEGKEVDRGVFIARPGIYFPMNPTDDEIKQIRARGVGKMVVLKNWRMIVESFEKYGITQKIFIKKIERFCGAKSSISRSGEQGFEVYRRAGGDRKGELAYGEWVGRDVDMSFDPAPKRDGVNPDGQTLKVRRMGSELSCPYDRAEKSLESRELKALAEEILEQPNADFTEFDIGEERVD
jgi:hypothetical protein